MIPLPDDFLVEYTARNIAWLKQHPEFLAHIFHTSTRETVAQIQKYLKENTMHVVHGYPRDETGLPSFSVVMAPENEFPFAIGDDQGTFDSLYLGTELDPEAPPRLIAQERPDLTPEEQAVVDYAEDQLSQFLEDTGMNATYRIECWSPNADLVSYMYAIAKWSTWGVRRDMYRLNWTNVTLSGMDLEPMTEYKPDFIYRRALQISMTYENVYYADIEALGKYGDMIRNPGDYTDDPNVTPGDDTWILCPHYYSEEIGGYAI